jgi:thiosulfate dehydrogenase [quinone] large subunit
MSLADAEGGRMENALDHQDRRLAYALLRMIAGLNLMMHGVSRLLAGPTIFAEKVTTQFAHTSLPAGSVWAFAMSLPAIEALLGLLLLIGLRTRAALVAASILIMVLTFGSSLVQNWPVTGLQLTYALVYAALLFLRRYNGWSLDSCLERDRHRNES